MAASTSYSCPLCSSATVFPTLKLYVSHLRVGHAKENTFSVMCGVNCCREVFRTFSAFNSHVYRHHRAEMGIDNSVVPQNHPGVVNTSDSNDPSCIGHLEEAGVVGQDEFPSSPHFLEIAPTASFDQSYEAAKMLLQLREGHQVSQVALLEVISCCRSLCRQALSMFKTDMIAAVGNSVEGVIGNIDIEGYDQFKNVDTNYLFEKYCIDNLGCLEALEIPFGDPYYVHKPTTNTQVSKTDKFYYVPILTTLKKLMELEDYQAEVLTPHPSNCATLRDFCDGSLFQEHPLFSINKNALQIVGYYDDLEVVNPLGSYTKKHKLGCLYFFLGNIRPQFRSTLNCIHLVAVGRTEDIQYYGTNVFLAPFVEDLKRLYLDGLPMNIGGCQYRLHGGLIAFLADTLAAHAVGGFKGSMSFSLRICRTCMVTPEQIQQCLSEASCMLRTPENYFEQCSLLEGPLKAHFSTTYGVNFLSVLEEVPGFSVINGLPHDIMHDLYEGIVPFELKLLLRHSVNSKYFTIDELNGRIQHYQFDCNAPRLLDPSIIRGNDKIRQSASQMMTLSQNLPLIIGDRIPTDDEHWKSYLLLLRICQISNSPVCSPDTIAYLRILIEEKLYTFNLLYPNEKLLPKHHYMVHYPAQMERLGPLIQCWTMRQEAKLSFVKKVARLSNYKNVCKTVAKKHCFWMCYQVQKYPNFLTPSITYSSKFTSKPLLSEDQCIQDTFVTLMPHISMESEIRHFKWIQVQSSNLHEGAYLLAKYDVDCPLFGKIIDILCCMSTVVLYVQRYVGELFHCHYNAFLIKSYGDFDVPNMDTIADHRPISVHSSSGELYAIMPYYN